MDEHDVNGMAEKGAAVGESQDEHNDIVYA